MNRLVAQYILYEEKARMGKKTNYTKLFCFISLQNNTYWKCTNNLITTHKIKVYRKNCKDNVKRAM